MNTANYKDDMNLSSIQSNVNSFLPKNNKKTDDNIKSKTIIPVNKRPIHCSDLKREVLHIKSNDSWEKEDNNGAKLLAISFIDHIKHRVFGETIRWKNDVLNPNSDKDDDRYTRVLKQMFGPISTTDAFVKEKEKMKAFLAKKTVISQE